MGIGYALTEDFEADGGVIRAKKINDCGVLRAHQKVIAGARLTDSVRLLAIASRDQARADAYARENGFERAYGSYDALLEAIEKKAREVAPA